MSNKITIEFSEKDRDLLEGLRLLLSALIDTLAQGKAPTPTSTAEDEDLKQKLRQIVKHDAETPQEATEAAPPTEDTPPEVEKPTEAKETPAEETQPTVTLEQIQQKVVQLCAADGGKKKAQVREIINLYGTKVSDLKERPDKWGEVMGLLTALEKEVQGV